MCLELDCHAMKQRNVKNASIWRLTILIACYGCVCLHAQETAPSSASGSPNDGARIFSANCASCHGLDGRGGERAPDIAGKREFQKLSNANLAKIVREGVPGTGMPSFRSLRDAKIQAVVMHLRALQGEGSPSPLPGSPTAGKVLFFGKAGCSECHMVNGGGGFIGSDLSAYGRSKLASEIRDVITNPAKYLDKRGNLVLATTEDGQSVTGIVRNEDNFSLQLQTRGGTFQFLDKSRLRSVERRPEPLMPGDYASRLSGQELDDLVSYIINTSRPADGTSQQKKAKADQLRQRK